MGPKKALLEQPIADLPAKRQRRPPKNSDYLVGDEVDDELNKPDTAPPRKAEPVGIKEVFVVAELMGEGDLHVVSTGRKVQGMGTEIMIFDSKVVNSGSALAKPFKLPEGGTYVVGDAVWVTINADAGSVNYIGGVYASEEAAKQASSVEYIHPSIRGDAEDATLEVVSLNIE
jgi:hypothetical protein